MDTQQRTLLLHVTTVPLTLGFLKGQVGYMRCKGFDVRVSTSPGALLDAFTQSEGVAAYAIPMERRIAPLRDLLALFRLWWLFVKLRPAIVHAQTPKAGLLATLAGWLAGVPVRVYSILGLPFMTAHGTKRFVLRWSEIISCRLSHRVLCVSQSMRQMALAEELCPAEKMEVLLNGSINGIDAQVQFNPDRINWSEISSLRQELDIPESCRVMGFVGRVVRDKGVVELTAAWRSLREFYPDLYLVIVGPLEPQDPIPREVRDQLLGESRVRLMGYVSDQRPLYALMDVVVLPTYREGFPVVPLEAAAMGVPVVATSIPGCIDAVVDGVTGTLVPPFDSAALAEAIQLYLTNPQLAHQHGQAGRTRVLADFQQEPLWDALYRLYSMLLREKGLPVPNGTETNSLGVAPS